MRARVGEEAGTSWWGSPAEKHGVAPGEQLRPKRLEVGSIRLAPRPDDHVAVWLLGLNLSSPDFPEPPAQAIPGHRRGLEFRDDESHAGLTQSIVHPDHVQVLEPAAAAMVETAANVGRARETMVPRQARRWRQEPPCFEGSDTVSRLRPFFRLRDSTARPHRVAMRARKPCLLMRRLLRGLYDGFIPAILQMSRES
jgi:hypothetical protein